jgi:hypothetical protein
LAFDAASATAWPAALVRSIAVSLNDPAPFRLRAVDRDRVRAALVLLARLPFLLLRVELDLEFGRFDAVLLPVDREPLRLFEPLLVVLVDGAISLLEFDSSRASVREP